MFQLRPLPRTLAAALRDAEHDKVAVRRSALRDLARLVEGEGRDRAVEGLCHRLLRDPDADVRADAALALADADARSSVDALLEAASDAHARVRQMAILALGELSPKGHRAASQVVKDALASEAPALRFQALLAAHRLELDDRATRWVEAVSDADPKVRYLALRLIDEHLAQQAVSAAEPQELEMVLSAVGGALRDDELEVRVAAAFVLAPRGDKSARVPLIEGLNRGVKLAAPEDDQELIELAGELKLGAAEPGLVRQAWGRFGLMPGRFAWQAKVALARLGNERARREILRGLKSWDGDARTLAVVAVGRAGLVEAKPTLETMRDARRADGGALRDALRELG